MKSVLDPGSSIFDRGEGIQLRRTGKEKGGTSTKPLQHLRLCSFPFPLLSPFSFRSIAWPRVKVSSQEMPSLEVVLACQRLVAPEPIHRQQSAIDHCDEKMCRRNDTRH
jgi:hypothetical protein